LFAALALPLTASAQIVPAPGGAAAPAPAAKAHHGHNRHNSYMRIMRGLNLTATQKQQIAGIMKNARGTSKDADQQTRRANTRAMRQKIESVLTDAQRTQLRAKLAQVRPHAKPNGSAAETRPQ
jgi:Spy/CpxP family protein refolding chaperone